MINVHTLLIFDYHVKTVFVMITGLKAEKKIISPIFFFENKMYILRLFFPLFSIAYESTNDKRDN